MNKQIQRTYRICTLDKHLDCSSCSIAAVVDCSRHKPKQMHDYYRMVAVLVIPSMLILLTASLILNVWWLLPGYILYWIFYQIIGELFIRCRHCPFWDESNPKLECRINCGAPKLQRLKPAALIHFNPGPLHEWEKISIQFLSFLTVLIPLCVATLVEIHILPKNGMNLLSMLIAILAIVQCVSGIYFFTYLTRRLCPTCIHFSCPNNHQPYYVIEAYLAKNKIMQDAWKKQLHKYRNRK